MTLDYIRQGKKEGSVPRDFKNEFIMFKLNHMIELMKNDELLDLYDDTHKLTKNLLDYFFHGILSEKKK